MEWATYLLVDILLKGTTEHYIKKGLEKIDSKIIKYFGKNGDIEQEKSFDELKKYLKSKNLQEKVESATKDALKNSMIFAIPSSEFPSHEDKLRLFREVLNYGFSLSQKMSCDLLLPGSLYGDASVSLFLNNEVGVPNVIRDGNRVRWPSGVGRDAWGGVYYIVPVESKEKAIEIYEDYKRDLIAFKCDEVGYYSCRPTSGDVVRCEVESISAVSIFFQYANMMSGRLRELLVMRDGVVRIENWSDGLELMLTSAKEIPFIRNITKSEVEKIVKIHKIIDAFDS